MAKATYDQLLHKYAHVGCPACQYDDNCGHPAACAEHGGCLLLINDKEYYNSVIDARCGNDD